MLSPAAHSKYDRTWTVRCIGKWHEEWHEKYLKDARNESSRQADRRRKCRSKKGREEGGQRKRRLWGDMPKRLKYLWPSFK